MAFQYLNETGIIAAAGYMNDVTGGVAWPFLLGIVYVALLIFFMPSGARRAFVASGFICAVLCLPLWLIDFIGTFWVFVYLVALAIGLVIPGDSG